MRVRNLASYLLSTSLLPAQTLLPSNYKTIFSNSDVVVMHVHYGAHEFVPMHDHPAVSTLYVYLNNSGEVDIIHEGPKAVVAHRPPTQTGSLRIAPGIAERHSVQSHSDIASDFLRVEFQHISFPELPETGRRIPAPSPSSPACHIEFEDASLRIVRQICTAESICEAFGHPDRTLLIAITTTELRVGSKRVILDPGDVLWLPATPDASDRLSSSSQVLGVSFLKPGVPSN
jgi:hypothetical protein